MASDIIRCVQKQQHLPSQTALTAAAARAAHLIVNQPPHIFTDRLAVALLGEQAEEFISYHRAHGEHLVLSAARTQATCRSRYTEDRLARRRPGYHPVRDPGCRAGLLRVPRRSGHRTERAAQLFEVDHPATQEWKRAQLAQAGLPVPDGTAFVPTDFEHGALTARLRADGFDPAQPALVSWLGVTIYLTQPAISQTLAELGAFAPGTELIIDYMLPAGLRDPDGQSYADQVGPVAAQRGEPWLTCLAPDQMSAQLATHGFGQIKQVSQRDSISARLWARSDTLHPIRLSMLAHATTEHATSTPRLAAEHGGPPAYSRGMPEIELARRQRLQPVVAALGADAALITSLPNVRYLTGLASSNAALLLPAEGDAAVLATDSRYAGAARRDCPDLELLTERFIEPALARLAAGARPEAAGFRGARDDRAAVPGARRRGP